jgi:hypothetical protein
MSGHHFCPHQRWWTFFPDLWSLETYAPSVLSPLPKSSLSSTFSPSLSLLWPQLPMGSLSSCEVFDFLCHLLYHPPCPRGHDCVMIREKPREFGITMVAWPLLWACLGECLWEEGGHPFYPFKYNVPFWGPPGLCFPREKKMLPALSLMYRALMIVHK